MTAWKTEEVREACDWLEKDFSAGGLLSADNLYRELFQASEVPDQLSDELTRGKVTTAPEMRLAEWAEAVVNQVISYATFPVLTSLSDRLTPSEEDTLEAAVAMMLAEVNLGQELTKEAYRGFLKRSHVVYQLVPGALNDKVPFSVRLPNIRTCFFERFKGGRPAMLSRKYDVLVRDAEKTYSGRKGEHDGAGKKLAWDATANAPKWEAVSGEGAPGLDRTAALQGRSPKLGDLVHVREFYDGDYCYHLLQGLQQGAKEEEVLRYRTNTGGVPFAVVPSSVQENGGGLWAQDWRPRGWPGYTRVLQLNRIETIRATRSEHVQDHIIARLPPDQQDAIEKLKQGGYAPVLHGGVNFIPLAAEEVMQWTQLPDADLKERATEKREQLERWIASWLFPATEQTIASANVGTAQIGMQVVHQQESGLIGNHNWGLTLMTEMMLDALSDAYKSDREIYAKDEVAYGRFGAKKVEPGKAIKLSAELLGKVVVYGQDANIRVEVITRSETESELEQREAGVWNNVQRGSQTFDEFIAVRSPNVEAAHERLAEDGIRRGLAQVYDAAIPRIAAEVNRLRWGVDVNRLMSPPAGPQPIQGAPASGNPGGQTTVAQGAPATGGVDVSSRGGPMGAGQAPQ